MRSSKIFLAAAALAIALPFAQANATVMDAAGDFLGSYTGPPNGDMDVLSADVFFDHVNNNFILSATMNGAIGTTASGLYVWGFDRGGATLAPFGGIGNPGVIFNAIVIINDNSTGSVTNIGGSSAALAAGSITISGNSFTAIVPTALLPSTGAAFGDYQWNLWPRDGLAGNSAIPDFAPDNTMASVSVPEPASLTLLALGLVAIGFARRRSFKRLAI